MITDSALAAVFSTLEEGEMIMAGTLLKGLSTEEIAWVVIETVDTDEGARITLHAYWHDIFVVSKVVTINPDDAKLTWGVTKT